MRDWFGNACLVVAFIALLVFIGFLAIWFSGPESIHHMCAGAAARVYPELRGEMIAKCIQGAQGK